MDKLLDGLVGVFARLLARRRVLAFDESMQDAAQTLFAGVERLASRRLRGFFGQLVTAASCDAYDFYVDIPEKANIFYASARGLTARKAMCLLKLVGLHHTVVCLGGRNALADEGRTCLAALKTVYGLSTGEVREFGRLRGMYERGAAGFEAAFAERAARRVFAAKSVSVAEMAYILHFFIASFEQFKADNPGFFAQEEYMPQAG